MSSYAGRFHLRVITSSNVSVMSSRSLASGVRRGVPQRHRLIFLASPDRNGIGCRVCFSTTIIDECPMKVINSFYVSGTQSRYGPVTEVTEEIFHKTTQATSHPCVSRGVVATRYGTPVFCCAVAQFQPCRSNRRRLSRILDLPMSHH